jgi:dTDP-4-dehydrorhamnose reductase
MCPVLLITGGSGFLGRHLVPLDVVIHTAGSNRSPDMKAVIELGTAHVARAAAEIGARMVHLSTDVLFGGDEAPYLESDPPRPIHAYGRAKANAEAIVAGYENHVIVRTSLIYGMLEPGHGARWLMETLRQGEPVTLFTDQWRNPIWVQTLCDALLELATLPFAGILHVAGRQALTRADFGLRMLDVHGFRHREMLRFGPGDPQRWPADVRLNCELAATVLQTPLLGVDDVLALPR